LDEDVAQWQLAASMMHRRRLRAGVVAAVLLLAAVVAEAQCPSKEQFDACVSEATVRYNLAAGDMPRAGTCFKSRACEFLKDVFFCGANDMECCTEDVSTTYDRMLGEVRPLGVLQVCDAINPCDPTARPRAMPAGCCPTQPGALSAQRVCCRSADCSLCNKTMGQYVLNNNQVPKDVHLRLEATPVGSMCPHGTTDGARQGYICNVACSEGAVLASTNHDYVYHTLVDANVPYR
jgi:hypothetical protein